jgi:hypothetical protein
MRGGPPRKETHDQNRPNRDILAPSGLDLRIQQVAERHELCAQSLGRKSGTVGAADIEPPRT